MSLMISKYNHKGVTWVNIEEQRPEELEYIKDEYGLTDSLINKLLLKDQISAVSYLNDYICGSFYFPTQSFSFILNKNVLITLNNQTNKVISEFVKNFETDASFDDKLRIENTGLLLFFLIKSQYADLYQKINNTKDIDLISKNLDTIIKDEYLLSSHKSAIENLIEEIVIFQFGERLERYLPALQYELKILRNQLKYQKNIVSNHFNQSLFKLIKKNKKGLKLVKILSTLSLVLIIILTLYVFSNI